MLCGIALGPHLLNIVTPDLLQSSTFVSNIALSLVAFSLGQNFTLSKLRNIGRSVFAISVGEVLGAFLLVSVFVLLFGHQSWPIVLILGAIAPATAPAAVVMVTREYRAKGRFTDTLLGVVAIDDAWSIILFAFCIAIAKSLTGMHGGILAHIFTDIVHALWEIFGSMVLGVIAGMILAYLVRFMKTRANLLLYMLGMILLTTGLSYLLNFSLLLTNMVLGATVANRLAHEDVFDILRDFDPPIYLLFFVLAGANLEIASISSLGLLAVLYIVTRLPGEMLGAFIGAHLAKAEQNVKKYLGLGLAPQAGVAIGLALFAKNQFPGEIGDIILSTIIVTTILYELFGPVLVRIALEKAGDIKTPDRSGDIGSKKA
ncbi:cation:proton antiporter [candidate division WOR-3 bacterium]|nr:cation:proton antiporter [candidate division WOR-3 bacterium]